MAANVSFKLGLQSAIDQLLIAKTGAEEGSFYLTSDTHRLYIGGKASPSDTDVQVFPVNEGVTTVDGLVNLPTYDTEAQKDAAAGRFYYVADANILCVFNGQDWIQINANDDTGIASTKYELNPLEDNPEAVEVKYTIADTTGRGHVSTFSILASNGLTTKFTGTTIEIIGNKYALTSKETDIDSGKFEIVLSSDGLEEIHKVILLPGQNVYLSAGADPNTITINADDTKIESVTFKEGKNAASTEGFRVSITDSTGKTLESDNFNPKIKYGKDNPVIVKFDNGEAALDIYTGTEIDDLLKTLNAMTYKGTVGTGGSFASEIDVQSDNIYVYQVDINAASNVLVPVSIGDTLLCKTDILYGDRTLPAGTMLIARSKNDTENANGGIDPENLTFDIIEATKATDTTYRFIDAGEYGVALRSSNGVSVGSLALAAGDNLTIEQQEYKLDAVGNFVDKVLKIRHNNIITNYTPGAAQEQLATMSIKIPVITNIETDGSGHIVGVETSDYTIIDSPSQVHKVELTSNQYVSKTDEKTQIGSIVTKVTTIDGANKQTTQEDSFNIVSKSLEIKVNNNFGSTENTETTSYQQGLSINMVWGEF